MDGKADRGNPQNAERSTELDAACRSVDGEISESGIEENKGTGISKQCGNRIYKLEITCSTKLIIV